MSKLYRVVVNEACCEDNEAGITTVFTGDISRYENNDQVISIEELSDDSDTVQMLEGLNKVLEEDNIESKDEKLKAE